MQFWLSAVVACILWLIPLVLLGPGFNRRPHGWGGRLRESIINTKDEEERQRMMESASREAESEEEEHDEEEPVEFVPVAPTSKIIGEEVPPPIPEDDDNESCGAAIDEAVGQANALRAAEDGGVGATGVSEEDPKVDTEEAKPTVPAKVVLTGDDDKASDVSDTSNELEEALDVDLPRSIEIKNQANDCIGKELFDEAIDLYKQSLDLCPRGETGHAAIIYSNMSYANYRKGEYEAALADASSALELNPNFAKAFLRRYKANRALDKVHDACADLKAAVEADPKLHATYRQELLSIEHESNERAKKEKDEMIGKLKDFGNWALGKVGMSLDNFQVVQDPSTGSYNIQYQPPQQAPKAN